MPAWMRAQQGLDFDGLTISCLPPFYLRGLPDEATGRHWLLTMTEGSSLPLGWADTVNSSRVERVIVPCQHNADVFKRGGVEVPIHVVPGGTDPDEFRPGRICANPHPAQPEAGSPYTFLAIADRGARKGWAEAWQAFFMAFGSPQDTPDVRLIIKSLSDGNDMLALIAGAENLDPRVTIIMEDMPDIRDFYRMGDCLVMVSRSEGFGMIMREGAACGLPVLTQRYSGMDDGYTDEWAIVVTGGRLEPIPAHFEHIAGEWLRADPDRLAERMHWCYDNQAAAERIGANASQWLASNQTWHHSAQKLLNLIGEHHGLDR